MPTTQEYDTFISTKRIENKNYGIVVKDKDIHPKLFDFQKDVVKWACKKGDWKRSVYCYQVWKKSNRNRIETILLQHCYQEFGEGK